MMHKNIQVMKICDQCISHSFFHEGYQRCWRTCSKNTVGFAPVIPWRWSWQSSLWQRVCLTWILEMDRHAKRTYPMPCTAVTTDAILW